VGRESEAIHNGLNDPVFESNVGAIFSAPVKTGTGPHPASYMKGGGSFPGVKWPDRDFGPSPSSSTEVNPFNVERLIKTSHSEPFKNYNPQ
jgi:hypothetical protein